MADRIIKSDSGNDVVIQNNGGTRKIEVTNAGDVEVTGDFKATTVKATNLKANDGTAGLVVADSTGEVTSSGGLKATNIKTTNLKANDGTAGLSIADSTGRVTFSETNPVITLGSNITYPTGAVIKKTVGFAGTGTSTATNLTGSAATSYQQTGIYTENFSCDSRTNTLIVEVQVNTLQNDPQYSGLLTLYKDSTDVFASSGENDLMKYFVQNSASQTVVTNHLVYVDNSPSTSATDYRVYGKIGNASNYFRIFYDAGTYMIFTELA